MWRCSPSVWTTSSVLMYTFHLMTHSSLKILYVLYFPSSLSPPLISLSLLVPPLLLLLCVHAFVEPESGRHVVPVYGTTPFVLFIWQPFPVLSPGYQHSPPQIALLPVQGPDPSQGSPLNLILIITPVINRQGLGGDYSAGPTPQFPLAAVLPVRDEMSASSHSGGRQTLNSVPLKIWGLWRRRKGKKTSVPMWLCPLSYLLCAPSKPPLPSLPGYIEG